jgi:amino acid transporter
VVSPKLSGTADAASPHDQPARLLSPLAAVALTVGIVIGAGIFKTPALVTEISGDAGWALTIWLAGALVSIAGALCYAELCTTYPHAGGDYHFLSRAWGRDLAFLYAWARATVINPGSIALLAYVFGDYFSTLVPLGAYSSVIWALAIVLLLTLVNTVGLHASAGIQLGLLSLEVAGLLAVVVAGLLLGDPAAPATLSWFERTPAAGAWGLALVFVLLTFGGWNESAYISAEVRGTARTMVWVIVVSMVLLSLIYLLVNLALLLGLGQQGLTGNKTAASSLVALAFGSWAEKALGISVAVAALTSINATMIVGARSNFALGREWSCLRALGQWQTQAGTPRKALWVQAIISIALVLLGMQEADGFSAMVEFTAPVFWGFLLLVGLGLMWLRHADPQAQRPFRVPLYPLLPLVFCAACAWLTFSSINYALSQKAIHVSLTLLATGVLAWLGLRWIEGRHQS